MNSMYQLINSKKMITGKHIYWIFVLAIAGILTLNIAKAVPNDPAESAAGKEAVNEVDLSSLLEKSVPVKPVFKGGESAMKTFIRDFIRYPENARNSGAEGTVVVSFTVDKNGKVKEPVVEKGIHPELDREAVHVVQFMPNWIPGKKGDELADMKVTIPIKFRLMK